MYLQYCVKSCGNKKCDEEEEEEVGLRQIFLAFWHCSKMAATWFYATFLYVYVHSVEDSTLMSIFDQFRFSFVFGGCQKSVLIAILKTPAGSISFNSISATMLPHRLIDDIIWCTCMSVSAAAAKKGKTPSGDSARRSSVVISVTVLAGRRATAAVFYRISFLQRLSARSPRSGRRSAPPIALISSARYSFLRFLERGWLASRGWAEALLRRRPSVCPSVCVRLRLSRRRRTRY